MKSFYGPNITPHPQAGIGGWTVERSERGLERAAAGKRDGVLLLLRVTGQASAGLREILPALRVPLGPGVSGGGPEKQRKHACQGASRRIFAHFVSACHKNEGPATSGAFSEVRCCYCCFWRKFS